jgi:N-acetylneuraminate synthase
MGTFLIAEAGVNHNGSIDLAKQLIDAAADSGADAVKFQTFKAERLVTRTVAKADYQARATGNAEGQLEMLKKLELSDVDHEVLAAHANARGIAFLSTPFDLDSLAMLVKRIGLETIKVPSGEITNAPFLLEVARSAKRMIVSTGGCTLGDIEDALGVLAFGMISDAGEQPGRSEFRRAFASAEGQAQLSSRVTLLHCTTEYPAPYADVNLSAMDTMAHAFRLPVGYSDHTLGIHIPVAAVARGACLVEKHFTLDRDLPGPDHNASLEPAELSQMVAAIRIVESAIGDGVKRPRGSEWKNLISVRRSVVATADIRSGERLTPEIIGCKRAGAGISPFEYWRLLGKKARHSYVEGDLLDE